MSIKLLDRCWRFSKAKGGDLLVLLGIADFASDEGVAYPSISTLAKKVRLTPRNTQRAIRRLVTSKELLLEEGKGPHRVHLYRIILTEGLTSEGCQNVVVTERQGDIRNTRRVTFQPPNPSAETVIKKHTSLEDDEMSPSRSITATQNREVPLAVEPEFEDFWKRYPMRRGKREGKKRSLKKWIKLNAEDRKQVLVAVQNYASSELVLKGMGIKDPHRWLRDGDHEEAWRNWIEPEQRASKKLSNGHGPAPACTKRVQGADERFLRTCGQPAHPQSRPAEPRCYEHLSEKDQTQMVTHAYN